MPKSKTKDKTPDKDKSKQRTPSKDKLKERSPIKTKSPHKHKDEPAKTSPKDTVPSKVSVL